MKKEIKMFLIIFIIFILWETGDMLFQAFMFDMFEESSSNRDVFWHLKKISQLVVKYFTVALVVTIFTKKLRHSVFLSLLFSIFSLLMNIALEMPFPYESSFYFSMIYPFTIVLLHYFFGKSIFIEKIPKLFKGTGFTMVRAIFKTFLFFWFLSIIKMLTESLFLGFLSENKIYSYLSNNFVLIISGFFLSAVCTVNVKRTAIYFGVLILVFSHAVLISLVKIFNLSIAFQSELFLFLDIIFTIPYIFVGVYLRSLFVRQDVLT